MEKSEMEEGIEILEFFKNPKTEKDACQKWGEITGSRVFTHYSLEGFIEQDKDKKEFYALSNTGENQLNELKEAYKKEKKNNFWKNPLVVGMICVILTALITIPLTYFITIKSIDYQTTLTTSLYGEQEITLKPGQDFQFNGILIYNPTSKKVNLENMYVRYDYNWIKWSKPKEQEQVNTSSGEPETIVYDNPQLQTNYKPYMELEAGKSSIMNGYFSLTTPIKAGEYKLYFYAKTLDGKQYDIDKPLIVKVVEI